MGVFQREKQDLSELAPEVEEFMMAYTLDIKDVDGMMLLLANLGLLSKFFLLFE